MRKDNKIFNLQYCNPTIRDIEKALENFESVQVFKYLRLDNGAVIWGCVHLTDKHQLKRLVDIYNKNLEMKQFTTEEEFYEEELMEVLL